MTDDEMRAVAAECSVLARFLAPVQDAGVFAPVTLAWSGIAERDGGAGSVKFVPVITTDGTVKGTLELGGARYVVTANLGGDPKPVIPPQLAHRLVNACLSAANTFNHILADGVPDPKRS